MDTVLETRGLSFRYGTRPVVDGLDLEVARGDIFGFVGPNGAGKTTTIKMILGLLTPSAGEVRVLGLPLRGARRQQALRRIGALVESPSLYGHLTAEENLRLQQLAFGVPAKRIAAVLEETGLGEARARLTRHFSLGMRQRLGIAMALLHEPELLVLDEPSNGLDPAGILELRTALKQLASTGRMSVFLSSHLLAQLEQTITRLAVISRGRLRYQGTLAELRRREPVELRLAVGDPVRAMALLREAGHAPALADAGSIRLASPAADAARVNALLVRSGIDVHELRVEQPNLERIYLGLMQDPPADAAGSGAP
jgi:lantibiotic transport system ATP-binding protein